MASYRADNSMNRFNLFYLHVLLTFMPFFYFIKRFICCNYIVPLESNSVTYASATVTVPYICVSL